MSPISWRMIRPKVWPIPGTVCSSAYSRQATFLDRHQLEEKLEVVVLDVGVDQLFALALHDADVHLTRMQIDSAVVFGRGGVIFHG